MALRLREREEVVMVLNEGAVAAGAACHKIPRSMPGIGYVLNENGDVTRVRVGHVTSRHVTDDMIREGAARFPAPTTFP
jgi:S-DNA-T family DNA segregation ATPase FtsK/SpoIIIE